MTSPSVDPTGPERPGLPLFRDDAWARALGWTVAGLGCLIVVGRLGDFPLLRALVPLQGQARPNVGVGLLLLGVALGLVGWDGAAARRVAIACAVATLVGAGVTLAEYVAGADWGVGGLLMPGRAAELELAAIRPSLPAALSLLLLGAAILLLHLAPRRDRWALGLGLVALVTAALGFFGYLFDLPWLASLGPFAPLSALAGISLLLLAVGVLAATGLPAGEWLRRFGLAVGFATALLLLLALGVAVLHNARLLVEHNRRVEHTYEVLGELRLALVAVQDLETGTRGFLLTGDPEFLEPARGAPERARARALRLQSLVGDHPAQLGRAVALARAIDEKLRVSSAQFETSGSDRAAGQRLVASGAGRELMDRIRDLVTAMEDEEKRLLAARQARAGTSTQRTLFALATGLGASLGLLIPIFVHLRGEIVARTRLTGELRRSEGRLAVTLDSIGDGVLATDTAGRVTLMNRVAEQLTGWRLADARGLPVGDVFRVAHERTRQPVRTAVEDLLATGEPGGPAGAAVLLARGQEEKVVAHNAALVRAGDGRLLGAVLVFRDVTVERRAQEQLDRFFELSLDFLCISSEDGYFKRVSPAVTDVLGWTIEEFLAMPYMDQVHPDDRAATQREVDRQVHRGEKVLHFENRYRHRDGSWRVLAWRSTPHGGFMYATARDVTEAREAEQRIHVLNQLLQDRAAQLEVANKELESFSYSVSHDLRAPLRHVQGYVDMLTREAQGALSGKGQRFLRTIAEAAREMGLLIDDLLSFSRMGRAEMREATVDTLRLVAEVRESLEREAAGRTIRWTVGELPAVRGDAAMLRIVFVNLLGNAVKYTRRRATAEIEVGCAGHEDDRVVFFVRDNGAGFDMKYADKLFGVFQRLHRADEFEGTGIGLATVRRIVGRHGGRTWAEGRPDAGATFHLTLPAASPPSSP